jgi:UDP-2,3-diacylglucosamine pyrophosphatase LpxH
MVQKKVVVISDVHLGYENCDRTLLNRFLDELAKDQDVTDLVLLGDIVDMWRRDASGVFLENRETINRILDLPESVKVHYVAGNHDYHVLGLKNSRDYFRYPIPFSSDLTITDGEFTYRFMHGYEFEYGSKKDNPTMYQVMDALCRVMSDEVGAFENDIWGLVTRAWGEIRYFLTTILLLKKREVNITAKMLQSTPETRLADTIQDLDRRAYKEQGDRPKEILVYGHTHRPFINRQENLVNSGSWVTDALIHGTYVELSGGRPRLFIFGKGEVTERVDISK